MLFYKTSSLLYTTIIALSLCISNHAKAEQVVTPQNHTSKVSSAITVFFKLKKRQIGFFQYTNSFFEYKTLEFSNPGDKDTSIMKTMFSNTPVSLVYEPATYYGKNKPLTFCNYTFIAVPGDTLQLAFTSEGHLNISGCKKKNVLSDGNNSYYILQNSFPAAKSVIPDNEAWLNFYSGFNEQYNSEKGRINDLLIQNQIDSTTYQRFLVSCKLHYYNKLFDWLFPQNGRYSKYCLPIIWQNITEIEGILKNNYLFATNELWGVMNGLVRARLIKKGQYLGNDANIYNEALITDLGTFKPNYLTFCILKMPVKTDPAYQKILADYKYRYKNSSYVLYADSILKSQSEKKRLSLKDTLITLNGTSIAWDDLIKSKKKFVVIDFWASWCIPCRQQLPYIDSIRTVLKNYPIEFVSVNVDKNIEDWKTVSRQLKYLRLNNYHLIGGKKAAMVKKLDFKYVPRYIVLNGTKLLSSDFTQPSEPSFVKELIELLKRDNNKRGVLFQ